MFFPNYIWKSFCFFDNNSIYERDYLLLCCFCAERKNNTTTIFLFFLRSFFEISACRFFDSDTKYEN